mmetsp:Transcript_46599/g.74650  ORF Transcript_46599/g.74650 Transcript_46599/m.74650 type:complete len:320 (+) Transcript_46599:38-997(+)
MASMHYCLPHIIIMHMICIFLVLPQLHASQFFNQFRQDCAKLSNEKTFNEGIDHWRSLFRNDSIIEMNDRIFEGSHEIDAYFAMHKSTFRRIQFDVIGENVVESSDGILSITLYATYVPREYLGCSSMMRWLAIFWYDERRNIKKMLLSSSTSLTQWREQLNCDWEADKQQIQYSLYGLMNGMYRDDDVETMVNQYYAINAKLYINDGSYSDSGGVLIEGRDNIAQWYLQWNQLGVNDVLNEIDEFDISGNSAVTRMVTMASHSSGQCSVSMEWYGLYKFNGKAKIVEEQRFYHQQQLETSKLILKNCGDLSPLPKTDL